jgi:hypothetical protein
VRDFAFGIPHCRAACYLDLKRACQDLTSRIGKEHVMSSEMVVGAQRCALPAVRGRSAKRGRDHAAENCEAIVNTYKKEER